MNKAIALLKQSVFCGNKTNVKLKLLKHYTYLQFLLQVIVIFRIPSYMEVVKNSILYRVYKFVFRKVINVYYKIPAQVLYRPFFYKKLYVSKNYWPNASRTEPLYRFRKNGACLLKFSR